MPKYAGLKHRRTKSGAIFWQIGHGACPFGFPGRE